MQSLKYKMVVSDLDGTLLQDLTSVSEENCAAIEKMNKMGIKFVVATGRSFYEIPKEIRENRNISSYICSGGAYVGNPKTDEKMETLISSELFSKIYPILREYKAHVAIHCNNNNYVERDTLCEKSVEEFNLNPYYLQHYINTAVKVDSFNGAFVDNRGFELISVFFKSDEDLFSCKERVFSLGGLSVTSSAKFNIEIVADGALKGDAIKRLAHSYGIETDEIIGVGDSRNDISMLKAVGMPLAVENANDALKSVAKRVICSHRDHVAKYILENIIEGD